MNRDIKFRAWDKENNRMWFTGQEGEDTGKGTDRGIWTFQSYFNKQGCFEAVIYRCFDNGVGLEDEDIKLPIMQYTGLKDKNGKDIYEGDILRCKCLKKCKLDSCAEKVIQYKNSLIEWWESGCNLGYRLRDSKGKTMMIKPTHLNTMEVEVIGNIYENPELLRGEE